MRGIDPALGGSIGPTQFPVLHYLFALLSDSDRVSDAVDKGKGRRSKQDARHKVSYRTSS